MMRIHLRIAVMGVCLAGMPGFAEVIPRDRAADPPAPANDPDPFQGLWTGAWGGGEHGDGVVFQPVIADLLIRGDHVELCGFRDASRLAGTVRFDQNAKQMHITPAPEAGRVPAAKTIVYTYEIKGDVLTLIDHEKVSTSLQRRRVVQNPLGNAKLELVTATGIDAAGDVLVTEFTVLRAGRIGATYFQPERRVLSTKHATVLLVQESGLKKVAIEDARGLIRQSTPVAVAYRDDVRPSRHQVHELWQEMGSPTPDSDAVLQTLTRILRPGTLVFVLSARANVPVP
jgi:hypothetical protein